ncbi:acetoin utilization protein AcuC [Thermodesulfobacteriota bacterium]
MMQNDVQKAGSIFVYSDEMAWFDFGTDHYFKPERAAKTYELCTRYGVMDHPWMKNLKPESINKSLLTLFHEPDYLLLLEKASQGEVQLEMLERGIGTTDNPILKGIFEWSLKAAGGTRAAMENLMKGDALIAFNPLGGFHHAGSGRAEGFCYINDIVIAIKDAMIRFPGIKVAYIDIDAHHGNGVQDAFYLDPNVLFISIHETGRTLYPWSGNEKEIGEGDGKGFTVNIPLEPDSDDEVFSLAFNEMIPPLIRSFSPDLVVAELGSDTLISDPLTHLKLTNNGYINAVEEMTRLCPRILALGGGGYDLYRTARCWTLAWAKLNRLEPTDEFAGLVGGMMFGPEMEVGSLYDHAYFSTGEVKEKAMMEVEKVLDYIHKEIFPLHGL